MQTPPTPQTLNLGLESPLQPPPPSSEITAAFFAVGDLVWGKIKNHHPPWWPGRVTHLDQSEDTKSILVSYFGNKVSSSRCEASQLKPLFENFDRMSKNSGKKKSRSFQAALRSALGEIGKCLESQLFCNCNRNRNCDGTEEEKRNCDFNVCNYSVGEFVGLVKDAAVANSVVGGVDVVKLRSWVVGFQRGVNVGHKRKAVADLVDKIDLDDPVIEEEENEVLVSRGRRKRSMAQLVAETGLGSDSEEEKKVSKDENDNVGGVDGVKEEEEEVGSSSRRERKKSKYLSPPYCYLSEQRLAKSLSFSKSLKTFSSSAIEKCSSVEDLNTGEVKSQVVGIDTGEVLAELLATGVDTMHLKWNRLAKTVKGFFAEYRSCTFLSGSRYEACQKGLVESIAVGDKFVNNDTGVTLEEGGVKSEEGGVRSEEGKKTEVKKGRKTKEKPTGEVENSMENSLDRKKSHGSRGRKRKDQAANGVQEIPVELGDSTTEHSDKINNALPTPQAVTASVVGNSDCKRGRKKSGMKQKVAVGLSLEALNNLEISKETGQILAYALEARAKTPTELGTKEETFGKNGRNGTVIDVPINLGGTISNGSGENKSRQRKKNKKIKAPVTLLLTFSSGASLPSKEHLISACSKYGPILESETEVLEESSSARLVFKRCADAENAFNDKVRALGELVATYDLSYQDDLALISPVPAQTPEITQVPKPPLPYIRRSLQRMISTLSGSPLQNVGGVSGVTKTEGVDNLVGDMTGLLSKVNKMLSGPAPGTSD